MKKAINLILSVISPLAAVPTGWAIFAGITEQPAFPVPPVWAGVGAVAVVVVNFAAGMLITDVDNFNHSNKKEEHIYSYPLWRAWAVLIVGVLAEIVLSLLIVVFPVALSFGVLAFPIMTLAGVFVISIRAAMIQRENARDAERVRLAEQLREEQEKAEQERQERREYQRKLREEKKRLAQVAVSAAQAREDVTESKRGSIGSDEDLLIYLRKNIGKSQRAMADDFGVSRSAVGQRIKKLKEAGLLEELFQVTQ